MMSPDTSNRPAARTASRIKPGRDGGGAGITAAAVIVALVLGMIGIFSVAAGAAPQIGQAAPDFTAVDSQGNSVQLDSYRGKTIVLEWTNADCPYTRKHYTSGNMQSMQALAQQNGVVWLTVISSAPGKQGYVNGPAANALTQSRKAVPAAVLLDPSGAVARLYAAKTTPHLFVIDKKGAVQYMAASTALRPRMRRTFRAPSPISRKRCWQWSREIPYPMR